MSLSALPSWRMFRQRTIDLFVLLSLAACWLAGRAIDAAVRAIAEPGRQAARLGADVQRQLTDAASQAAGVPVVGAGLRQPFDGLAASVDALSGYATQQVAAIDRMATVTGWLVFAIPLLLVAVLWLPRRLAFARRARDAKALARTAEGSELLALRALVTQPLGQLKAVASDPVVGWRSGDPAVIERLAALELAAAGVARRPRRR